MKHWYTLILAALPYLAWPQPYTPFLLENVEWTMKNIHPTVGPGDDLTYWKLYTTSDTVANNLTYKQIFYKKICYIHYDHDGDATYFTSFQPNDYLYGGLREEGKKVFFRSFFPGYDEECLLYDFDVAEGDTVFHHPWDNFTIIDGVDTSGEVRSYDIRASSAFAFPYETGRWTEGRGSSYGLMGSFSSDLVYLVCYKVDGTPTSPFWPDCEPCSEVISTSEIPPEDGIRTYPNPAGERLFIESRSGKRIESVLVFDIYGRLLLEKANPKGEVEMALDISGFEDEILILKIGLEGQGSIVRKVVRN